MGTWTLTTLPATSEDSWPPRRVIGATLVVASVAAGFLVLYLLRWPLLLLFTAVVLATALRPVIEWLRRRGLNRSFASVLMHVLVLIVLLGFLVGVVPMIVQQGAAFVEALPQQYHHLRQAALESPSRLVRGLAGQLPSDLGVLGHLPAIEKPLVGLSVLWQFVTTVLGPLSLVLAVFLMSVYWSIEGERTILALLLVVPGENRE
jgi:predicted PurR-regulated permease PerM